MKEKWSLMSVQVHWSLYNMAMESTLQDQAVYQIILELHKENS
jgi:hypothetical protein